MARAMAHFKKAGGLRAMLRPSQQSTITVSVQNLRGLKFCFEQHEEPGIASGTGGSLWYADRVLAEYLACERYDARSLSASNGGTVLVLGCGGVPLSGLVACSLGWRVVLTDLKQVLAQTRHNVHCNIASIRSALGLTPCKVEYSLPTSLLAVHELPFGDRTALQCVIADISAHASQQPLMMLCSDCVWMQNLHRPLLTTIAAALAWHRDSEAGAYEAPPTACALVMFLNRDRNIEASFLRLAKRAFSLKVDQVDLQRALSHVEWPEDVQLALLSGDMEMSEEFSLYRMELMAQTE